MALGEINNVKDLHDYLYAAMQLEHATIPPYLTAMYTMKPDTNLEAYNVIRIVVVEEMLHLTLAANVLNAIGGTPNLNKKGFVPEFPTYLPDGETDFEVDIATFSKETIDTFLSIERPAPLPESEVSTRFSKIGDKARKRVLPSFCRKKGEEEKHFYSIGQFYAFIGEGLKKVAKDIGEDKLFSGSYSKQITPEYYYSGGGDIIPVKCLKSALSALELISEQGEGDGGKIYDTEGELAHYYRFEQLKLGKYYHKGDKAGEPSGEAVNIDWDAVYPIIENPKMADYPKSSSLYEANVQFNTFYKNFLAKINDAFNGNPQGLIPAIGGMFVLKNMAYALIHNPVPGKKGFYGAPTFEIDKVEGETEQVKELESLNS